MKKKQPSAHLAALEQQFESHTRRFNAFEMLGLPSSDGTTVVTESAPKEEETRVDQEQPVVITDSVAVPLPMSTHQQDLPGKIAEQVYEIPLEDLVSSPDQPRQVIDAEADQELIESIRQQGVLNPIQVRQVNDKYEVIAGERRWRACKMLGKLTVPALIRATSNDQAAAQALVDNLVRKDLSPLEEARAFQSLLQRHGYQQNQLADKVGCHKSRISRALGILKLPAHVLDVLFASGSTMTARHADALLPLLDQPAKMERITRLAVKQRWSSDDIRAEVDRKPRFNQGAQCIRVTLRGEKGSKGFVAAIRWSPNQQDKVESVRQGIQQILEVLDEYGQGTRT
ncbi:MAG: ParB/RepB/Spo0J family partition protein [Nitrospirota bacterium]